MKIAIVESDLRAREELLAAVRRAGFSAESAADAAGALALAAGCDVLVVGLPLAPAGGLEAIRAARFLHPGLETIVLTGEPSAATWAEAMELGSLAYLARPFPPDDLLAHLAALAGRLERAQGGMTPAPRTGEIPDPQRHQTSLRRTRP